MSITTIKIYQKTKINLDRFKEHRKESYDDILKKILYILDLVEKDPELGKRILEEIEAAKARRSKRMQLYMSHPKVIRR
ncbi:MAG: hypothetical protein KKA79_05915 [Nanoarchaeota archaeon]|nr:hypothetical protein [Nanoarchaeota archaeon]MCG2718994.1 hypothetical protein [Nanoarchaeota archaeon]